MRCLQNANLKSHIEHVENKNNHWDSPHQPQHLHAASLYPGRWLGHILSCNCRAELCGGLAKYRARLQRALSHGCGYELAAPRSVLECNRDSKGPGMPVQDRRGRGRGNNKNIYQFKESLNELCVFMSEAFQL